MDIVYMDSAAIKPYENNPRENASTIEALVASITRYGFNVPLVLDADGVIICGHARWQAARKLKMRRLPCVIATDLTPEQVKRYRLADNKVQDLTRWDQRTLLTEVREFESFSNVPGFTSTEIDVFSRMFSPPSEKPPKRTLPGRVPTQGQEGSDASQEGSEAPAEGSDGKPPKRRAVNPDGKDVTQEQIDKRQAQADSRFEERDAQFQESLVAVTCAGCGEVFEVLRQDLIRVR